MQRCETAAMMGRAGAEGSAGMSQGRQLRHVCRTMGQLLKSCTGKEGETGSWRFRQGTVTSMRKAAWERKGRGREGIGLAPNTYCL